MNKKIVLDTNCLVQMISMHSPYRPAWQAFFPSVSVKRLEEFVRDLDI